MYQVKLELARIPTIDPFLQGIFMVNTHHFKSNNCTLEFNVHITYNTFIQNTLF